MVSIRRVPAPWPLRRYELRLDPPDHPTVWQAERPLSRRGVGKALAGLTGEWHARDLSELLWEADRRWRSDRGSWHGYSPAEMCARTLRALSENAQPPTEALAASADPLDRAAADAFAGGQAQVVVLPADPARKLYTLRLESMIDRAIPIEGADRLLAGLGRLRRGEVLLTVGRGGPSTYVSVTDSAGRVVVGTIRFPARDGEELEREQPDG